MAAEHSRLGFQLAGPITICAEPIRLPADTRIEMEFVYDNSAANPRNPNSPPQRVTWGPGVEDEMAGLHVQAIPVYMEELPELGRALWGAVMRSVGGRFYTPPARTGRSRAAPVANHRFLPEEGQGRRRSQRGLRDRPREGLRPEPPSAGLQAPWFWLRGASIAETLRRSIPAGRFRQYGEVSFPFPHSGGLLRDRYPRALVRKSRSLPSPPE